MQKETDNKYYLIRADSLPDIYIKVNSAKSLLETGEAKNVQEAVSMVGISRSAFYKYKDAIRPFVSMSVGQIVTFQLILKDNKGVLSAVLSIFADAGANILTINQSIPGNGKAPCTIAADMSKMHVSLNNFREQLERIPGVIKTDVLAGQ